MKQETVQKLNLFRIDAERQEWIEIKRPNLDILNAFAGQTIQRLGAAWHIPLGANSRVELIFQLQQIGINLHRLVAFSTAYCFIFRIRRVHRAVETFHIGVQFVIANK